MKILFFDIETTGVKHWRNGIHQISGCVEIDGEVKQEFNYNVQPNPACDIEEEALKVGNVTKEQVLAYPEMKGIFQDIETMLGLYVDKFNKTDKFFLAGYNNASFDNQFLRAWFVQNAKTPKDAEYGNYFGSWFWSNSIDVMVLAAQYLMDKRHMMVDFKLKTVAVQLGIDIDETKLHDAAYDIELTREIYKRITI